MTGNRQRTAQACRNMEVRRAKVGLGAGVEETGLVAGMAAAEMVVVGWGAAVAMAAVGTVAAAETVVVVGTVGTDSAVVMVASAVAMAAVDWVAATAARDSAVGTDWVAVEKGVAVVTAVWEAEETVAAAAMAEEETVAVAGLGAAAKGAAVVVAGLGADWVVVVSVAGDANRISKQEFVRQHRSLTYPWWPRWFWRRWRRRAGQKQYPISLAVYRWVRRYRTSETAAMVVDSDEEVWVVPAAAGASAMTTGLAAAVDSAVAQAEHLAAVGVADSAAGAVAAGLAAMVVGLAARAAAGWAAAAG